MISGILLLSAVIGIFVVVIWELKNDSVRWNESTTGILRMGTKSAMNDNKKRK